MRSTRPANLLAMLTVGFLGIYWAAGQAQERPALFAPPPVLPSDPLESAKPTAKPANPPKSAADPALIIPAAVYEEPRTIKSKKEPYSLVVEVPTQIVQTGGVQPVLPAQVGAGGQAPPAPMFPSPPTPSPAEKKPAEILPPLPAPLPEPTKALILEPAAREAPKAIEPSQGGLPQISPPMNLVAPPIGVPPAQVVAPAQPSPEKPKGFVRIRSERSESPSVTVPAGMIAPLPTAPLTEIRTVPPALNAPPPLTEIRAIEPTLKLPPPPTDEPIVIASSVQTPGVTVEKRGPTAPRAGTTVSYQIIVRNQGPLSAQQIRIEDELAPDARFITAEPMPILNGNKVAWTLSALSANQVQVLRMTVQAGAPASATHRTSVQVSATSQITTVNALRPANATSGLGVELIAPKLLAVGKPAVFEIRVVNHTEQPLSGLVLHGALPPGLSTPEGRTIEGDVGGTLQPGEAKTLRMPTDVVQAGRFTVEARVTTQTGQAASASTAIEIGAESLQVSQAANTRIFVGRDGDLRIDVTNSTSQTLRHVAVSDRLPEGLDYAMASERGLYQANSRTVHWLIDSLPAGASQTLHLRLFGAKPGNYSNSIVAKADGGVTAQSSGTIAVQAVADVSLRVIDKDRVLEVGRETSYEILLENPGHASLTNVRVRVEFPPGMVPKNVQANSPYTQDRQSVAFEPIGSLQPQEKALYRVSAVAQTTGDQRIRFAVVSDQVPTPIVREISTLAYRD